MLERTNEMLKQEVNGQSQRISFDYYFFTLVGMLAAIFEIMTVSVRDGLAKIGIMKARDQEVPYNYGETGSV